MIHVLEEQDHAIATLTHNIISLKAVIKNMMTDVQSVEHERNRIKKVSIVSNMITTNNADVSVRGRDSKPSFL
jgi:Ran GTPase-activating protein (RanGAP) involved in mRNA processing and transport